MLDTREQLHWTCQASRTDLTPYTGQYDRDITDVSSFSREM